ncbi:MAG: type II toxin-antitoxin system PemK/MazF family toxin [Leuconostoc pseudomesenteroides]|uniref:type II toxin-antitoxin system PemK/MazF family toxin n=1 Tax=Leuconostoc pseudomesenteroides TaxID=33968 RepID=UPI001E3DE6E1|nr:type II toxin-antitoxin system PemK/MazF family toxin [Leuconostoc pseudomesenteroides]MCC7668925.1 type II toxin-antitoxin system PemK/MazF family toxin [Leuconostoc pseudomesenteroides]
MVKQGDIIKLNFNPSLGHEQQGYRPAIILSSNIVGKFSGLYIIAPISSTDRSYPAYHKLTTTTNISGQILLDQTIALDLVARKYKFIEKIDKNELIDIINHYKLLFDID